MTPRHEEIIELNEITTVNDATNGSNRTNSSSSSNNNNNNNYDDPGNTYTTKVVQSDPNRRNISYIHCTSTGSIPEQQQQQQATIPTTTSTTSTSTTTPRKTAAEINATELNLFFGHPFLQRSKNRMIVQFIHWVFTLLLIEYWESYVYYFINTFIPVRIKRYIIYQLWYMYFPFHQFCFGNRTGIHADASMEYHALTTTMYWFRFLPNSIVRMRFALHQLTCCQPQSYYNRNKTSGRIERIDTDFIPSVPLSSVLSTTETTTTTTSNPHTNIPSTFITTTIPTSCRNHSTIQPPERQKDFCRVKGLYIHYNHNNHHNNNNTNYNRSDYVDAPTEYTLFWLYGGAFLSGDVYGNVGPADTIAYHSHQMDVFLVEYRLAPEYHFDDIAWDVVLAYRYLYELRRSRQQDPNKILLFGCSSGAALCIRLMQYISEMKQQQYDQIQPSYIQLLIDGTMMPSGAVLASPYLDYSADLDPHGSFVQYSCHDLIVTEAVQEVGLPYLNTHMGPSGNRTTNSPFFHTMKHLPPLCVIVSQHETVYDETMRFIHNARNAGVPVTVGIWKYMCHVFLFFNGFIPEAQQAMDFICTWYKEYTDGAAPEKN
jgi:acetyl esterase/lipase